jgi:hypothetical protein
MIFFFTDLQDKAISIPKTCKTAISFPKASFTHRLRSRQTIRHRNRALLVLLCLRVARSKDGVEVGGSVAEDETVHRHFAAVQRLQRKIAVIFRSCKTEKSLYENKSRTRRFLKLDFRACLLPPNKNSFPNSSKQKNSPRILSSVSTAGADWSTAFANGNLAPPK